MAERVKGQRDLMPEEGADLIRINAGEHLDVLFRPQWRRDQESVIRSSIYVARRGWPEQSLRFDPFSADAHYHIRPVPGEGQIPLSIPAGQTPLEAVLALFEDLPTVRGMLIEAEEDDMAGDGVIGEDLAQAASEIRAANAQYPLVA